MFHMRILGSGVIVCAALAGSLAQAQVKVAQAPDRVTVDIGGQPYTALYLGPETTKPYLHPLRSASGKIVTRRYPMEQVAGETKDHPHHRGLWYSHGDVNGTDFWDTEPGESTHSGKIVLERVTSVESGAKSGSIAAQFKWIDSKGKALLEDSRKYTFTPAQELRIIDFDITMTALEKVTFGDTKEGTFAIRLAAGLEEPEKGQPTTPKRTGKMVNAQGATGEDKVWGKRSEWVDHYGIVDGEEVGIAIFDCPLNPRFPTWWHSRAYGLFAANPFGLHDFEPKAGKNGSLVLEPKQKLRFRYRVVIHHGDPQSAGIKSLYEAYRSRSTHGGS
ncbi:MAG TPA: PmoA family protein [Bryobacteraceae bacterium]